MTVLVNPGDFHNSYILKKKYYVILIKWYAKQPCLWKSRNHLSLFQLHGLNFITKYYSTYMYFIAGL